jgi:hypothetical protein
MDLLSHCTGSRPEIALVEMAPSLSLVWIKARTRQLPSSLIPKVRLGNSNDLGPTKLQKRQAKLGEQRLRL